MNFPECFDWPLAQNFGYRIVERLEGYSQVIEDRKTKRIHITGHLALGDHEFVTKKKAKCAFEVGSQWISEMPDVTCLEPWLIRKIPEWHVYDDGRLCFEFGLRWVHELTAVVDEFTIGPTADYATAWLLSSTRSLLRRHLFASREGITTWPKSWDYWAHSTDAAKRQLRHLLNKQTHASTV